jgi:hypothetical protein
MQNNAVPQKGAAVGYPKSESKTAIYDESARMSLP